MHRALAAYAPKESAPRVLEVSFLAPDDNRPALHPFRAAVDEKRRSPRRRVLLSALVVNPQFNAIFRCRVRDVSEHGARLDIPKSCHLPAEFWLIAISSGLAYEAKAAWRRYPDVGVSVGEPINLDETTSRIGRRLRGVWLSVVS